MLCEGCEGDGAGDCTCAFCVCAFAAGTAVARSAAVRNGVHDRIVQSPIVSAAHLARPCGPRGNFERRQFRQVISRKRVPSEASDVTCRKGMPEPHMEPGSGTSF